VATDNFFAPLMDLPIRNAELRIKVALCVFYIGEINTRYNYNLHFPSTNLTLVQKGVLFSGSKIYNHLPLYIKMQSNDIKHFKSLLRTYLTEHVFYSIDEYYQTTCQ
jgi:hypothetical protein